MLSNKELMNEVMYNVTMDIAFDMLKGGIISECEYKKINDIMLQKYDPIFSGLFADI